MSDPIVGRFIGNVKRALAEHAEDSMKFPKADAFEHGRAALAMADAGMPGGLLHGRPQFVQQCNGLLDRLKHGEPMLEEELHRLPQRGLTLDEDGFGLLDADLSPVEFPPFRALDDQGMAQSGFFSVIQQMGQKIQGIEGDQNVPQVENDVPWLAHGASFLNIDLIEPRKYGSSSQCVLFLVRPVLVCSK